MQHKHIFAALLCGALCLTGCLKNEESASVTQVRNAKANELNANAELLKAQAAAATTLANAEATLKQAQAELEKANAALVNAQAETEKVQAELLKVRVQLQQVKVEEEKVALKIKEAELEQALAELEVAKAKAEADKQFWVNWLNQLKAEAAVQALEAEQALLEAQKDLDNYLLTAETEKAEAIKEYADKYFALCEELIALQKEAIDTEVAINSFVDDANAYLDYLIGIYYDDQATLAYINEYVEWLKTYQTATPEELEAKWAEAWEALNAVVAEYDQAQTAYADAVKAENDFWNNNDNVYWQSWYGSFRSHFNNVFGYPYAVPAEVIEGLEPVYEYGYYIPDENDELVFVPTWRYEDTIDEPYFYEINVETGDYNPTRAQILEKEHRVAAKIYFDNMETMLDMENEFIDEMIASDIEDATLNSAANVAVWEERIATLDERLAKEEEYLSTRQSEVEKAEKAFEDAVEAYNEARAAGVDAWAAYRDYMIMQYDVESYLFTNIYDAKQTQVETAAALVKAESDLATAKAKVPTDKDIYEAKLEAAKKQAAYNAAVKAYNEKDTATKLAEAAKAYDGKGNGTAEVNAKNAQTEYDAALVDWRNKNIDATAFPDDKDKQDALTAAKKVLDEKDAALAAANKAMATAKDNYDEAKKNDDEAKKPVDEAKAAWDAAKKVADDMEAYTVDPKYQAAVDAAKIKDDNAKADVTAAETALANRFKEMEQEGVKYEDDAKFVELYEAYLKANEGVNKLGPGYYWDAEKGDYVPGAALAAWNKLQLLYRTVYENKDLDWTYSYFYCAYDLNPEVKYISGYGWNAEKQAYEAIWEYYSELWEPEYDEEGYIIWNQVFDDEGNPVCDPSGSRSYIKEQLQASIEAAPAELEADIEAIKEGYQPLKDEIAVVKENLALYKQYEPGYLAWIDKAQELSDATFDAEVAALEAEWKYQDAKAEYQAIRDNLGGEIVKYEYDDETEDYVTITLNDVNELIEYYEMYAQFYEQWIEEDYQAIVDYLDDANIDLDKLYMDYELILKKIVVVEKLVDEYKAILEELLGVDLDVFEETPAE